MASDNGVAPELGPAIGPMGRQEGDTFIKTIMTADVTGDGVADPVFLKYQKQDGDYVFVGAVYTSGEHGGGDGEQHLSILYDDVHGNYFYGDYTGLGHKGDGFEDAFWFAGRWEGDNEIFGLVEQRYRANVRYMVEAHPQSDLHGLVQGHEIKGADLVQERGSFARPLRIEIQDEHGQVEVERSFIYYGYYDNVLPEGH